MKLAPLLLVLALVACGEDTTTAEDTGAPTTAEATVPDETDFATAAEAKFLDSFGRPIADACQDYIGSWHCFYEGVTSDHPSRLDLHLAFTGDIDQASRAEFAAQARLHWFNFIGKDFPDLDTIVSYDGERDIGHTLRRDVPLLNRD